MICYVLNLERHQIRLQWFLQQFDSSDLAASELRRFRAVDAASVWPHARALVYEPALARLAVVERLRFRQTHFELPSRGGIGCALSHLCSWLDILSDAAAPANQLYLVMEDDATLPRRLLGSLKKALQGVSAGWDILLLGCRTPEPSMVTKHTTHVDIRMFQGTHAYLISKAAVRKIFENGALPLTEQIDAYLSGLAQATKLKIYALPKRLVGTTKRWGSSIQLDYDFEFSHAKLTYNHPFEMVIGSTSVEDLQRLDALRAQHGVDRLRQETRPKNQGRTRMTKQLRALLTESAPNKRLQATPYSLRYAPASGRA
jgi:GR25 family glycosyltransferase involved in LPS biosynthesis